MGKRDAAGLAGQPVDAKLLEYPLEPLPAGAAVGPHAAGERAPYAVSNSAGLPGVTANIAA